MENRKHFKQFYSKLTMEGVIKAIICGLIVGLAASFITAFVAWLLIRNGLIASIIIGTAVSAAAAPLFYYKRFKPTAKMIAHRVDRLGMEERMITMLELENDQSYMALCQREDAKQRIESASVSQLKLRIFRAPLIILGVLLVFSVAMNIVSVLSENDKMPWSPHALGSNESKIYTLEYEAGEGGHIYGETLQQVVYNGEADTVVAIAHDGYVFDMWSDESPDFVRTDRAVSENIKVQAIFIPITGGDPGNGDKVPDGDSDGRAEPQDMDSKDPGPPAPPDPDAIGGTGAGGEHLPKNQVIDNETYYRMVYQEYYDKAIKTLEDGRDLPQEVREIIEAYFGIII